MRYFVNKESYMLKKIIIVDNYRKKLDPRPPVVVINVLLDKCFTQVKKLNSIKKHMCYLATSHFLPDGAWNNQIQLWEKGRTVITSTNSKSQTSPYTSGVLRPLTAPWAAGGAREIRNISDVKPLLPAIEKIEHSIFNKKYTSSEDITAHKAFQDNQDNSEFLNLQDNGKLNSLALSLNLAKQEGNIINIFPSPLSSAKASIKLEAMKVEGKGNPSREAAFTKPVQANSTQNNDLNLELQVPYYIINNLNRKYKGYKTSYYPFQLPKIDISEAGGKCMYLRDFSRA